MIRFFRRLFESIMNLLQWFWVIWNDRQWDHSYLYEILYKKITLMLDWWNGPGVMSADDHQRRVIDDLMTIKSALHRLMNEDYYDDTEMVKRFGELKMDEHPSSNYIWYREKETPENREEIAKLREDLIAKEEFEIEKDLDKVFGTLKLRIRHMWD